jgi:HemY protein
MRTLFAALLLLFVAAALALVALRNPGYVLIAREPYVLETSLAVFLLFAGAAFVALYYGVRLGVRILRAPRHLARWRQTRRTRRAREAFHAGLRHLIEGEWLQAEKSLLASLHAADAPLLAYLAAALAAHGQNDPDKRDGYLARAQEHAPDGTFTADLLQARLLIATGQLEAAHATLAHVYAEQPALAETLRLLIIVYRRLRDWPALARLLPEVRRRRLLPEAELGALELEIQRELLSLTLPSGALATLHRAWDAVPTALRTEPALIAAYVRQLLRQDAADEGAALLAATLEKRWDESLAQLYGEVRSSQPAQQLENAEEWLARHGESRALLLALARLARANRLPERARGYLEKCLALAADGEAHRELGALYEDGGDKDRALDHYRQALVLCQPATPAGTPATRDARGATDYGY